jgi:hypothetical protein
MPIALPMGRRAGFRRGLSATRKLSRNGVVGSLSSTLALKCGLFIQFRRPERFPWFPRAGICCPSSSSFSSFLSSPTRSCRHFPTDILVLTKLVIEHPCQCADRCTQLCAPIDSSPVTAHYAFHGFNTCTRVSVKSLTLRETTVRLW